MVWAVVAEILIRLEESKVEEVVLSFLLVSRIAQHERKGIQSNSTAHEECHTVKREEMIKRTKKG